MKFTEQKSISVIAVLVLVSLAIFWRLTLTPFFLKIPENFSYSARLVSLDNFYDEKTGTFKGDERSVTSLSYQVNAVRHNIRDIKNTFSVRTVSGDPIFNVTRLYAINASTLKHDEHGGDRPRTGYLFAPRHLRKGQSFIYWHVNYDAPAQMRYVGEENIFGLTVFHYHSDYQGERVDQSANLNFLPGVPEKRGVEVEPQLDVWIEPVSGYLVKYQDRTQAYFYDRATHARLNPWNIFFNGFTHQSVVEHIAKARTQKIIVIFLDDLIPAGFILGALLFLCNQWFPRFRRSLSILCLAILITGFYSLNITWTTQRPLTIGIARWSDTTDYDPIIDGFKSALREAGYSPNDITYITKNPDTDATRQENLIKDFLKRPVDLIFSLTAPGTVIAKNLTTTTPIVFSLVTYPVEANLVKSLEHSDNNLVGTQLWVPPESQLHTFRALLPKLHTIGFAHRSVTGTSSLALADFEKAAQPLGLKTVDFASDSIPDLVRLISENYSSVEALYVSCDSLMQGGGEQAVVALGRKYLIPVLSCFKSGIEQGALAGFVADFYELGRLAGAKAALILEGASPTSLETSGVSRPFLFVNQKSAEILGITIPPSVLVRIKNLIH